MNYIKKKIKGHHHKKGHDEDENFDLEPITVPPYPGSGNTQEAYVAIAPLQPFAPDKASERAAENKNSEEWQFFQQLTQRVQDTVQKSQTTLSKLKDNSAVEEISKPDYELSDDTSNRANPGTASWVNFEEAFARDTTEDTGETKKPTRPPPPRPPPPPVTENIETSPSNILEDFGFQDTSSTDPSLINGNIQALLVGADELECIEPTEEDGDDPFDTSFVNETDFIPSKDSVATRPVTKDTDGNSLLGRSNKEDDLFLSELGISSTNDISELHSDIEESRINEHLVYEDDKSGQPDPFDTSFVDVIHQNNTPSEVVETETDEMNNPFLTDDSGFMGVCSQTPAAKPPARPPPPAENGYARPRKMSTNPFEMTDLLEDFLIEGSTATSSIEPATSVNAFDLLDDPVPSFGQEVPMAFQEASGFQQNVSVTSGESSAVFGKDMSKMFSNESSNFGEQFTTDGKEVRDTDTSLFSQPTSSPYESGILASDNEKDNILFGQELTSPQFSQGSKHGSSPFSPDTSNFVQDASVFGQDAKEIRESSLPYEPNPQPTDFCNIASSDFFDPFTSQPDIATVPLSSGNISQNKDDPFLAAREAEETFPMHPTELISNQPKMDPAVRNVISTLEKIASFATADDAGPPAPPPSSLFPGEPSKNDSGTGDSTPHAMDFLVEAENAVSDTAEEECSVYVFEGSDMNTRQPDSPLPQHQKETADAFAEAFLFGEADVPRGLAETSEEPCGKAFDSLNDNSLPEETSSFTDPKTCHPFSTVSQHDPFSSEDLFDASFNQNQDNSFVSSANEENAFSQSQGNTSFDPFSSTVAIASNENLLESSQRGDAFDSSNQGDPFGTAVLHSDDLFRTSETELFNTSNIDDPFSVSNDVTSMLQSGTTMNDVTNFEPVKDSVPFTDTAAFEAFAAKFEQAIEKLDADAPISLTTDDIFDPFGGGPATAVSSIGNDFGAGMDSFDPFKAAPTPAPIETLTPKIMSKYKAKKAQKLIQSDSQDSFDDDDEVDFSVVIRPKMREISDGGTKGIALEPPPMLPPPPKSPARSCSPPQPANRINPFNKDFKFATAQEPSVDDEITLVSVATTELPEKLVLSDREPPPGLGEAGAVKRTDSQESPTTPLYDEDTSQPLEEFLTKFAGDGWDMMLRQPSKKKITGNRYWKKVFVRLSDNSVLQLYNKQEDNEPFQELPLQACYSLSEVGAQQYDNYGKIFTVKLHYIFYRERVGVRPGQIHKVMQGQFTSVGQIAKLGLPLEHAPQVSQLLKIGTQTYNEIKTFIQVMEDTLFHLSVHRDRALTYKTEEIQLTVHDELLVDQRRDGHVLKQKARVRIFFLAFMTGMPDVEVGLNDLLREGKEVVGRYDIIPVVTEEWIRIENAEFHCCVVPEEFHRTRIIKLLPPDACLFELMRFRIRPPRNRELPLQVKASMRVNDNRVELRGDILVPGYHSRKHGQVPCEDIQIRFPIPECWIYLFRVEKHFRYGSLKSAARKPGKIKGLERIMGTAQSLDPSLIEVSSGQAKYEHSFKAVVWRMPRLPKEGQGAYTTQLLLIKLDLTSFDQIPDSFEKYVHVEFTMPATTVSHTTVRSISVSNETPPEKYVKYVAKHEYRVEIDMEQGAAPPLDYEAVVATDSPATKAPSAAGQSHHSDDDDSD